MFRDTQEELDRLTEELLEGEELPEVDEDILDDAILNSLLEDAGTGEEEAPTDGTADQTDAAQDVQQAQEEKDPVVSFLTVLALLLMAGILGVLVWWLIQIRSFF